MLDNTDYGSVEKALSDAAAAMREILDVSAAMKGTQLDERRVDAAALLQFCPNCGRAYFYSFESYYLTHDPVPE